MNGILITGGSSGLGRALALAYARPGNLLFLTGRDQERLGETAELCRRRGAQVEMQVLDVRDGRRMEDWVFSAERRAPVGLVIANAGISGGTAGGEEATQVREIFSVNVDGVLNTVLPAIRVMKPRRRGQIAIMASLAAFRGQPGAPAYAASKAAVKAWGEGLRGTLAQDGIGVSVICPGFVTSSMTAINEFPMPFLMSAERAARLMKRGIDANRARIAFPWPMVTAAWLMAALPPGLTDEVLKRLPKKR